MKIENTEVYGFRAALRAMRNPMDSWDKSDSEYRVYADAGKEKGVVNLLPNVCLEQPVLGEADLKLACKLIRGGSEHRKFLRQIIVWVDFTLPRYVWQELDTYKVATVRNSCSTMHKLGHRELTHEDFEGGVVLPETLQQLNLHGRAYREKKTIRYVAHDSNEEVAAKGYDIVRRMKAHLPESFLQKATWTGSYETLLSMFFQREKHRLPQWRFQAEPLLHEGPPVSICNWIYSLPFMDDFIEALRTK